MNKDQIKGKAKDLVGKTQDAAGRVTGNDEQQVKGLSKQVTGKVQEGLGNAKESVRNMTTRKTH